MRTYSLAPDDEQIRAAILQLLQQRQAGVTACPSEVARALSQDGWRDLMLIVRAAARGLAEAGVIEVTGARANAGVRHVFARLADLT